jgi:hypothetical protein
VRRRAFDWSGVRGRRTIGQGAGAGDAAPDCDRHRRRYAHISDTNNEPVSRRLYLAFFEPSGRCRGAKPHNRSVFRRGTPRGLTRTRSRDRRPQPRRDRCLYQPRHVSGPRGDRTQSRSFGWGRPDRSWTLEEPCAPRWKEHRGQPLCAGGLMAYGTDLVEL